MNSVHPYEHFRQTVQPAIQSKIEELHLLGYGIVSEDKIWSFLINKKWKKTKDEMRLYEIVQEIISIDPGQFMSYQTVEALKSTEFSFQNEEEWKELLK